MANGRVGTGYSNPYVAVYTFSSGSVDYTDAMPLARGVGVSLEIEASEDNVFYADNIKAETASGVFTSGTVTLTVDGLKDAARKLIFGLPSASGGWTAYDNTQNVPYCGVGFIVRYMENGVSSWVPVVLPKVMFNPEPLDASTQEDEIDWQTTELTATISRDDTTAQTWKYVGEAQTNEAAALALITAKLA